MFVSIIMPAYNAEKTIGKSIESVINQEHKDFELIIVNDCSQDMTAEIIDEYAQKDSRIKVFQNEKNSGVSYSRNFAIAKAGADYIAFLDSDDLWRADKLKKQVELIEKNPDIKFVFTGSSFIGYTGEPVKHVMKVPDRVNYRKLLKQNIISCSSVLIKKTCLDGIKMPDDKMHEDFATWLEVLKKESYAYGIDEPLLIYRLSLHSKSSNKIKAALMNWKVYRYTGLNLIQGMYYMLHYTAKSIFKYSEIKKSGR